MESNELRIGNLVNCYDGFRVNVTEVTIHVLGQSGILSPIRLTEEWLLRFGFTVLNDSVHFRGLMLSIEDWGNEKGSTGTGYFYMLRENGMLDLHVQYVHQLQNLFFALTRKELEYCALNQKEIKEKICEIKTRLFALDTKSDEYCELRAEAKRLNSILYKSTQTS